MTLSIQELSERIRKKDASLWKGDATNRLGWISLLPEMRKKIGVMQKLAGDLRGEGYTKALLLGMGGSSLSNEVIRKTLGIQEGFLDLRILDSTHPGAVGAAEEWVEPGRTSYLVCSKSGSTAEVKAFFEHFHAKESDGKHFIAITDPGSPLEALAREKNFRHTFLNPADIGGRFSALSYFGLAPAALTGVDLMKFLSNAESTFEAGVELGAQLARAAQSGKDKLTLFLSPEIVSLGGWIEQLIAESTGKEGIGILPVTGELPGSAEVYGEDRFFLYLCHRESPQPIGEPHTVIEIKELYDLGAEFYRWEVATAAAGAILGINPFDEPNVIESKDRTNALLKNLEVPSMPKESIGDYFTLLSSARPGDFAALLAFIHPTFEQHQLLQKLRVQVRDKYRLATSLGIGPRYLHSTGQYFKGGPNKGNFLQIIDDAKDGIFGRLIRAQAMGDRQALEANGRRVVTVSMEELRRKMLHSG